MVARGTLLTVTCAVLPDRRSPAKEFLDGLDEGDLAKLTSLFQRMADEGKIWNREQFKKLEGPIFEFKSFKIRMPCFRSGCQWVLTHGFWKKKDKIEPVEISRAKRIMKEDLER